MVELAPAGLPRGPFYATFEGFTHEDNVIWVLAGGLYFRYHQTTELMIPTTFSHPRHKEGGPNHTADTKRAATWAPNF